MKRLKLLALLAVFALFAAACGGSDSDSSTADGTDTETTEDTADEPVEAATSGAGTDGELTLLQWQAPSQANVLLSGGTKDALAASLVLEPLARINPDGELVPYLAAEIPSTSNGGIPEDLTSVTWNLKEDVVWSDGTPFTSADVVFTWEYCVAEGSGCSADAYSNVVDVVADGDFTVTINFDGVSPWAFSPFVGTLNPVIQAAQFADCIGAAAESCSEQNLGPIGTGPFIITDFRPEDTVTYEFNPLYRGNSLGQPAFGNVTIKGGGDAEASARSVLEIGEADYAWNLQVDPTILGPMAEGGNGTVVSAFTSNVEHINLNQTNNRADGDASSDYLDGSNPNPFFFENPMLARALSLAINRDDLVAVGYGAAGAPTCNIWNKPGETSSNNDWCLTQDVAEANRILDEDLGYLDTDGDGVRELPDGTPLEFSYITSTNGVRQSNQDLIKSDWEEIGVVANMGNEDASLFFDGTNGDVSIWRFPSDMEMFTNGPSNPDAQAYMSSWQIEEIPEFPDWGGSNMARIASDEYDKTWAELSVTPLDDPNRNELIIRLNDIVSAESGGVIPLIYRANVSAFANSVGNTGPLNGWDSEYWNIHEWTREG